MLSELEARIVAVERINEYTRVEREVCFCVVFLNWNSMIEVNNNSVERHMFFFMITLPDSPCLLNVTCSEIICKPT